MGTDLRPDELSEDLPGDAVNHRPREPLKVGSHKLMQAHPTLTPLYQEKFFSHNNVKQTNKNRLIFKDKLVSGLKTGHTSDAGYCLVAAKSIDNQNLISVVMGASSEQNRDAASQTLLNYGFRFYETRDLFKPYEKINQLRVYGGSDKYIDLLAHTPVSLTVEKGKKPRIEYTITERPITLPLNTDTPVADLHVTQNSKEVFSVPLYSSREIAQGGWFRRAWDKVAAIWNNHG